MSMKQYMKIKKFFLENITYNQLFYNQLPVVIVTHKYCKSHLHHAIHTQVKNMKPDTTKFYSEKSATIN